MKKTWRSALSMLLALCLMLGVCSNGLAILATEAEEDKPIKYVSIGDSMTNGYGFYGYNQDLHLGTRTSKHMPMEYYNYFGGTGVYGQGSYALQFEKYLAEKLGNEVDYRGHQTLGDANSYSDGLSDGVDHIQLATSAFRTEELATYLGLVENQFDASVLPLKDGYLDNSWNYVFMDCTGSHRWGLDEYRDPLSGSACCGDHSYIRWFLANPGRVLTDENGTPIGPNTAASTSPGSYTTMFRYLSKYYQDNVATADIISMQLGNAAFDAYFMDRLFKIWGALGETFDVHQNLITLTEIKDQLCDNDAERAFVDKVYEAMCAVMADQLGDNYGAMKMDKVCELLTYITFSYMYNYKQIIARIGELNPDAKIMIVGMLNSYSGLYLDGVGGERLNLGELMGTMYEFMNSYVAGIAADYMEKNEEFVGTIYYVEQPEDPEMIASKIAELADSGWGTLDNGRLDGAIVRYKTITAYNDTLYYALKMAGVAGTDNTAHAIGDCNAGITTNLEALIKEDPNATIKDLMDKYSYERRWVGGSIAYLGCEAAMVESLKSPVIDVDAIATFANTETMVDILKDAPKPFDENQKLVEAIADYQTFFETNMMGVIRFFAFNKMGNGIAAHPTPSNHDRLVANMIAAYEYNDGKGYTVQDKCKDNPAPIAANKIYTELTKAGLLTLAQTLELMDFVVNSFKNDELDLRSIAHYVYFDMFTTEPKQRGGSATISASEKLQVLEIVYGVIKECGMVDAVPQIASLENLYVDLTKGEDPLVSDEKAIEIFDLVVNAYIKNEKFDDAVIESVTTEIVDSVLNDPSIPVAKKTAIAQKVGTALNVMMTPEQKVEMIEKLPLEVYNYLKESGKLDDAHNMAIDYATELVEEIRAILEKDLQPMASKLEGKLNVLNGQYIELTKELDKKLADLAAKQEELIDGMLVERATLIEELEALNAKLVAVKDGSFLRTVPTTDALDAMIADLEAAIAETEAELAELDAAIAWAYEQIVSDKSGIEAIKAAIAEIKANIAITEAALVEVNSAINKLVADLAELDKALAVLGNLAGVDVKFEIEDVIAAVITIAQNLPEIIEQVEYIYNKVVETAEKIENTVISINNSVEVIKAQLAKLYVSAEEIIVIAGEQGEAIHATVVEMHELAKEFVFANIDEVNAALEVAHDDVLAVILREVNKLVALYEENEELIKEASMAALGLGLWYCQEKGYIDYAKDLLNEYAGLNQDHLDMLKADLSNAEYLLMQNLQYVHDYLLDHSDEIDAEIIKLQDKLVAYGETLDPVIRAEYERTIAALKAEKAKVEAKLDEIEDVIKHIRDCFNKAYVAIQNVQLALEDVKAAALVVNGDIQALIEALKNLQAAACKLAASAEKLHDAVVSEVNRVLGYAGVAANEAIDVIESLGNFVELINHIPAILKESVIHATNDHFLVSQDSHFVALGDANAYGAAADLLAAHLSKYLGAKVGYDNATVAGQTAADLLAMLPELKETLAKADLVTIGFSANTFTQFVVDQVSATLMGYEAVELDWEGYLGEEGAAYVAEAMAELKAELEANGAGEMMGMNLSDVLALAIESYAYAYMEFVINYVQVVDGVHAINPEAQVVLVGMHNPMAGVILDMNGTEIALGDYLEYIVKVSNAYAFGYAYIVPETIYVDAPAVETANETGTQSAVVFLMNLLMTGTAEFVPTDAGYAYIEEQIWNALNVYKQGLLGDVDSNGVVNHIDAMLVLQYYTEVIGADDLDLGVADVDGNGVINHVDSMLILQYYTEVIEVFPAA